MQFVARTISFAWVALAVSFACGQSTVRGVVTSIGQPDKNVALLQIESLDQWTTVEGPLDVKNVVRFGNPKLIRDDSVILLEDGSQIVSKELRSEGTTLHAFNPIWDDMTFPLRSVRGLLLRAYLDSDKTQHSLDRIAQYDGNRDRLVLINGDYIDGTFRRLTPLQIEFQLGENALKLDRNRVAEILFAQSAGSKLKPDTGVWVGLSDGSMLLAQQLRLMEDRLELRLARGQRLRSFNLGNAYNDLTYLRPVGTDVRYLSDMKAIGFKSLGFLSTNWDYRKDRNVLGGTLKSDGFVSQKGLGLHATSRLAYRVGESDKRFRAKVGIDDDTDGGGSVIFKVFATEDGKAWKNLYESPIVRGGQAPLDVDVYVDGMKGIALVVEFADGADVLDHANWFDARFESE